MQLLCFPSEVYLPIHIHIQWALAEKKDKCSCDLCPKSRIKGRQHVHWTAKITTVKAGFWVLQESSSIRGLQSLGSREKQKIFSFSRIIPARCWSFRNFTVNSKREDENTKDKLSMRWSWVSIQDTNRMNCLSPCLYRKGQQWFSDFYVVYYQHA